MKMIMLKYKIKKVAYVDESKRKEIYAYLCTFWKYNKQ